MRDASFQIGEYILLGIRIANYAIK